MRSASRSADQVCSFGRRARGSALSGLATISVVIGVWGAHRVTRACSCAPPPSAEKALSDADAVFEARPFGMSADTQKARYSFQVDRVWKGAIGPRTEIVTAVHSATCGRSYQVGTTYVIYARRGSDGEWTDYLCSRTRTARSAAEDLEVLGAGHAPVEPGTELLPESSDSGELTEPPRIQTPPPEPPPTEPSRRGCAVEKPHAMGSLGLLGLLGLAVAAGRRRAVGF